MIWVLLDVSYLAYRARYAIPHLQFEDFPTGVVFGFFEQLRTTCQDLNISSNQIALFYDSKHSLRQREYPDYKKKRREDRTEEEISQIQIMHKQLKLMRQEILPDIGIPTYRQNGLESDDIIASAASQFRGGDRTAVIISADGDLYQCIRPAVNFYDPGRSLYYTVQSFREKHGIHPKKWGMVKAIAGCKSDNVTGIPGVGDQTAVDYLLGQLPTHIKRHQAIVSPEGQATIERNKPLVILPHRKTKPVQLREPEYNVKAFFRWCKRLGIESYLKPEWRKEWKGLFSGEMFHRSRRPGESR